MKFYSFSFITIALVLAACSDNSDREPVQLPPVEVTVEQIGSASNQSSFIAASGKIEAENSADISTRIMGYITSLNVKIGQRVIRGQLIATISNADLEAQKRQAEAGILQAQAGLDNAEKDYNRFKILFDKKSATEKELDDMTTRFNSAKAGVESATQMRNAIAAQMAYTRITAPFAGEVTQTFVKAGDMANPGMPLISIEGTGQLQAVVMVPESEITDIKKGMPVDITIKSLNKTFKGVVAEKSSSANHTGGQYIVKINLKNPSSDILSGMFVDASFPIKTEQQQEVASQILLPKKALINDGQLQGVYVVDSNRAILRWLQLGKSLGDEIEVLSGLKPGEKYILSSEGRLFNGAEVSY